MEQSIGLVLRQKVIAVVRPGKAVAVSVSFFPIVHGKAALHAIRLLGSFHVDVANVTVVAGLGVDAIFVVGFGAVAVVVVGLPILHPAAHGGVQFAGFKVGNVLGPRQALFDGHGTAHFPNVLAWILGQNVHCGSIVCDRLALFVPVGSSIKERLGKESIREMLARHRLDKRSLPDQIPCVGTSFADETPGICNVVRTCSVVVKNK